MVKKTIAQQPDGESTRTSVAVVAFEEGGVTFKGSIRPNPTNTHYVKNQAQLESALGSDLIIPAGVNKAIVIDESFTLTKPFKKQAGSSILLYSESSNVTLTYVGTGALLQMDNPGVDIGVRTQISNLTLSGSTFNQCFAIEDLDTVTIELSRIQQFAKMGFIKGVAVLWRETGTAANKGGIDFINCPVVTFADSGSNSFGQTISAPITLVNFITDAQMDVVIRNSIYVSVSSTDEFIFIDPNMVPTGSVTVRDTGGIFFPLTGRLFQKGVDEAVIAVEDNGSGKARFESLAHGQVDNTYTVLSGFSESTYNGTFLVTVLDANRFDVEEIDFVATDSGNVNRSSLDSTAIQVLAEGNPDQPDSMFTGDAGLELPALITVPIVTQNIPVPITNVNWTYNNLERFEEDLVTPNQGRLIAKDFATIRYAITYSATINRTGGGGINVGIVLIKNDVFTIPSASFNPPRVFTATVTPLTRTEIIELATDDVIQVAVVNFADSNNIDVYQANLTVERA